MKELLKEMRMLELSDRTATLIAGLRALSDLQGEIIEAWMEVENPTFVELSDEYKTFNDHFREISLKIERLIGSSIYESVSRVTMTSL